VEEEVGKLRGGREDQIASQEEKRPNNTCTGEGHQSAMKVTVDDI